MFPLFVDCSNLFFFILFPTCHERSINVTPIMGSIEIPTAMSRRTGTAAAEAGRREHRRRGRPQRETVCGTRCCHCQEEEQKEEVQQQGQHLIVALTGSSRSSSRSVIP